MGTRERDVGAASAGSDTGSLCCSLVWRTRTEVLPCAHTCVLSIVNALQMLHCTLLLDTRAVEGDREGVRVGADAVRCRTMHRSLPESNGTSASCVYLHHLLQCYDLHLPSSRAIERYGAADDPSLESFSRSADSDDSAAHA